MRPARLAALAASAALLVLPLAAMAPAHAADVGPDGVISGQAESYAMRVEYDLPLPAVLGVKEGLNLPRYPSVPGRLRARKKEVERVSLGASPSGALGLGAGEDAAGTDSAIPGPTKRRLRLPAEERTAAEVIGQGPEAAPAVVDLLQRIGVLAK